VQATHYDSSTLVVSVDSPASDAREFATVTIAVAAARAM